MTDISKNDIDAAAEINAERIEESAVLARSERAWGLIDHAMRNNGGEFGDVILTMGEGTDQSCDGDCGRTQCRKM